MTYETAKKLKTLLEKKSEVIGKIRRNFKVIGELMTHVNAKIKLAELDNEFKPIIEMMAELEKTERLLTLKLKVARPLFLRE